MGATFRIKAGFNWVMLVPYTLHALASNTLKYIGKKIKEIVYVERNQHVHNHHNTAMLFQNGETIWVVIEEFL
jgi:hypothetical protein